MKIPWEETWKDPNRWTDTKVSQIEMEGGPEGDGRCVGKVTRLRSVQNCDATMDDMEKLLTPDR